MPRFPEFSYSFHMNCVADGDVQGDNQNDQPPAVVNGNLPEAGRQNQNHFFLILKEIQMFVIGFITSLLPGFHHHHE